MSDASVAILADQIQLDIREIEGVVHHLAALTRLIGEPNEREFVEHVVQRLSSNIVQTD